MKTPEQFKTDAEDTVMLKAIQDYFGSYGIDVDETIKKRLDSGEKRTDIITDIFFSSVIDSGHKHFYR